MVRSIAAGLVAIGLAAGQGAQPGARANAISQKMSSLRGLPANERATATKTLALTIRDLPSVEEKLTLAAALSNLATEGDAGKDTLQAVADTLAEAIRQAAGQVVRKFLGEHPYSFPILLDPGGETGKAYLVQGIPNTFVYDRGGKIVATGADQRTERQFLEMLGKAGLR